MKVKPIRLTKALPLVRRTTSVPKKRRGYSLWIMIILVLFINLGYYYFFDGSQILFYLIPILFIGTIFGIRQLLFWKIIQDYGIFIPRKEWAMNEKIPVRIRLKAKSQFKINKIEISVLADETFTKRKRGKAKIKIFYPYEKTITIAQDLEVKPSHGKFKEFTEEIPLCGGLPSLNGAMEWKIKVRIDIPKYPDIKWSQDILVVPFEIC